MRSRTFFVLAVLVGLGLIVSPAATQAADLGTAVNYVVLGLSGDGVVRADLTINSSKSIEGDIGIGAFADSSPNQKVDFFDGTVWVHSTANFSHVPATFDPSGGIQVGTGGDAIDLALDLASAEALTASKLMAGMAPTHALGTLNDESAVVVSTGPLNVVSLASLNLKSDVLEFVSRPGFEDSFVVNVTGDKFTFSQSEIRLTGTTAGHLLFNFLHPAADVTVKKSSTIFAGTLLAPSPTAFIEYHNPATFDGAIIGYNIDLHSDFRIRHVPFVPVDPMGDLGSIGDRVWHDLNLDGAQGAAEPGLNGASVSLFDGTMTLVETQVTSGDGNYLFADLPADVYLVVVNPSTLGLIIPVPTFDFDGTGTEDEATVTLGSGENNLDVDFGYAEQRQ